MTLLNAMESKPLKGGPSYSLRHRLFRAVWNLTWLLLAAWTPAPLHRWRVFLLNIFGAQVDISAHVYSSVKIWYPPNLEMEAGSCLGPGVNCYSMANIRIHRSAVISQGVHLCTGMHDIEDPEFQLLVKPISVGKNAWIAAECFVGPGVDIGEGSILGARSVLFRNSVPHGVYVGNPAVLLKYRALFDTRETKCGTE